MKNLILSTFILFLLPKAFAYTCNTKVDASKVMVFVDTNNSPAEIKGAAKAACARGEAFLKIPSSESQVDEASLTKELSALSRSNKSVVSMIVSGHNGGGSVHGTQGGVDKFEIINALKKAYAKKPNLLSDMKSIFMWGCWSMGPAEVEVWRKEIPSIKLASGFMDMGPLNTTTASHTVLTGLLIKEKSLIEEADQKKLKKAISSIDHINMTYASVYTEALCGNMYYYNTNGDADDNKSPDNPLYTSGNHFLDYDSNFSCDSMKAQIESARKEIIPYYYGTKELPKDEPNSPIRKIYSFLRKAEGCIKENHILNPDRVVLLRFFDEVKENFANVFKDVTNDSIAEFNHLKEVFKTRPRDPDMLAAYTYFHSGKAKFFATDKATLKTKGRKEINEMISFLDGLTKLKVTKNPNFSSNVKNLKRLKDTMSNYLFHMNPKCMNFLEWHEVEPGHNPYDMC